MLWSASCWNEEAEFENALQKAEHKNVFNNMLGFAVLSAEFENALQNAEHKIVFNNKLDFHFLLT